MAGAILPPTLVELDEAERAPVPWIASAPGPACTEDDDPVEAPWGAPRPPAVVLAGSGLPRDIAEVIASLALEPDPEAAAFLNAPRRPLTFYVAPFGTPPFGPGPAYPAGA